MSASGTRDSLRHALGAALERAERHEAAAEEARQRATEQRERAESWRGAAHRHEAAAEEARQERDAAYNEGWKAGYATGEIDAGARIGELEAALREMLEYAEHGTTATSGAWFVRAIRAALQPTTDQED